MEEGNDMLPPGWALASLQDLVSSAGLFSDGDWIESKDQDPDGDVRLVQLADIGEMQFLDKSRRFLTQEKAKDLNCILLRRGDVLISRLGDPLGKACIYPAHESKAVTAVDVCIFRPNYEGVNPEFFSYLLNGPHLRRAIDAQSSGTTRKRITGKKLKALLVPVPPTGEQHRIVDKIDTLFGELDQGEAALRKVQALLVRYRQSVLKAAVTGQLTADWRTRNAHRLESGHDLLARILDVRRQNWQGRGKYKEPVAPDTEDLPELPEGWVWATLDQLLVHLTSGSRDWKQYYGRGDGTFIMAQNVRPLRFDLSERFKVDPPPESPDAVRSELRREDVLITIVGANTGDICRFPLDDSQHYVCQSVALLRLAYPHMARYVELFLASKGGGREQIEAFIYGAGRPHLSFEQLRSIIVPLPSNEEQHQIADVVEEVFGKWEQIASCCTSELTRSTALRQSILKNAFAGKLVPQDPADEPASALLARIYTERVSG